MPISVKAVYENGTLKLAQPLPFQERETVCVTVESETKPIRKAYGILGWKEDHETLERILAESEDSP